MNIFKEGWFTDISGIYQGFSISYETNNSIKLSFKYEKVLITLNWWSNKSGKVGWIYL